MRMAAALCHTNCVLGSVGAGIVSSGMGEVVVRCLRPSISTVTEHLSTALTNGCDVTYCKPSVDMFRCVLRSATYSRLAVTHSINHAKATQSHTTC